MQILKFNRQISQRIYRINTEILSMVIDKQFFDTCYHYSTHFDMQLPLYVATCVFEFTQKRVWSDTRKNPKFKVRPHLICAVRALIMAALVLKTIGQWLVPHIIFHSPPLIFDGEIHSRPNVGNHWMNEKFNSIFYCTTKNS